MAHVYLQELMPQRYKTTSGLFVQFADSVSLILVALYNRYVSRHWIYFQALGMSLTFLSLVTLAVIPDSPKYLYSKGRFNDARKALQYITRFNGFLGRKQSDMPAIRFDKEVAASTPEEGQIVQGKLRDLFRERQNTVNFVVFSLQWITGIYAYYNIYF